MAGIGYTLPDGRTHYTLPAGERMRSTAREVREIATDETRLVSVSFDGKLDVGETLTGTPVVTAEALSGLVLSAKAVNSAAITVNGRSVAIGEAVQFKAAASAATVGEWDIDITCGTTAGQTLFGRITVEVVAS